MYRSGLVFGFALGGGAITANNCVNCGGGAGGLEAHLGGMINPQLALLGEILGARARARRRRHVDEHHLHRLAAVLAR